MSEILKMISMSETIENCEDCEHFECYLHPDLGWTAECKLDNSMWGDCPLIEDR